MEALKLGFQADSLDLRRADFLCGELECWPREMSFLTFLMTTLGTSRLRFHCMAREAGKVGIETTERWRRRKSMSALDPFYGLLVYAQGTAFFLSLVPQTSCILVLSHSTKKKKKERTRRNLGQPLAFWDGPRSVCGACISLNTATSPTERKKGV